MEKLLIKSNGQWSLLKSKITPYNGVYPATNFRSNVSFLNPTQQAASHSHILDHYKKNNLPIKDMVNSSTGQTEPHLLMGRGIHNESLWKPDASGPNMFDWSTNPNSVTSTHHTVVGAADNTNNNKIPPYADAGDKAISLNFWVPLSNVVGGRKHLSQHALDSDNKKDDESHTDDHILIRPGNFKLHSKTWVRNGKIYKSIKREDRWTLGNDSSQRDRIKPASGADRQKHLEHLATQTPTRQNKAGETEYLLHRGVGEQEHWSHQEHGIEDPTSWTPHTEVAQKFADKYNSTDSREVKNSRMLSAWVPEKHITSIPFHNVSPDDWHYGPLKEEHEVIVKPHKFNYHKV